ncbi:uncharacterized protein LOC110982220 [Acanthaster planci]|uniref:Uncharacterized protein LOC110982220 n=1 Tax=Acanthaster planci TaxID=133434 RepID=A0A8B7YUM4_ACAPL|nr:uncharacterized protein LOC110982220 [Acanthaster planci]
MASRRTVLTVKSVLTAISEGHLECTICCNRFIEPKILDCRHSFCLSCLTQLKKERAPYRQTLKCPLCRQDTKLKENDVAELPNNFTLNSLVEEFAKQEELLEGQSSSSSSLSCPKEKTDVVECITELPEFENLSKIGDVLAKISEEHLECTICSNRFNDPKLLNCGHSFCLTCLTKLRRGQIFYGKNLTCPLCRQDTKLMENDVTSLPSNFTLSSLVEEFAKQEELLEGRWSSPSEIERRNGTWQLKAEIETVDELFMGMKRNNSFSTIFHVAAFSNNEVVAVHYGKKELIQILDRGKVKSPACTLEVEDLTRPRRVAVNKYGQLIVLNYPEDNEKPTEVKIFSRDLKLLHEFEPEQRPASCIAVNNNNQIGVGCNYRQELLLYTPDGSILDTLSAPRISEHLASYKQRWIYTNWRERKLRSIDSEGETVFAEDIPSSASSSGLGPAGVCCDKNGDIYVALNNGSTGGEIHRFSEEGEHIDCVVTGCGSPRGITITPDGDYLAIAALRSAYIYQQWFNKTSIVNMAQSISAQSLLEKISTDHLECSICTNRFSQPKVLDCLHSFCSNCLVQLLARESLSQRPGSTLKCPLCRRETTTNDVRELPDNFTLSALVEEVTIQEKLLEDQGAEITCQACEEENPAEAMCIDCDHFLCRECRLAHGRMVMMKSHQVHALAQLRSGEITYKSRLRETRKCRTHPDQKLCFYCNTCEELVCTTCCIVDHTKPEHSLVGLAEASQKCKQDVASLAVIAEQRKTDFRATIEEIDKSKRDLEANYEDTGRKISRKADEEVAKIRGVEEKLNQELEKIYRDKADVLGNALATNKKKMSEVGQKLDEVHRLIDQASCCEIIYLRQKLLHNLQELTKTCPKKPPSSLSLLGFEGGYASLSTPLFKGGLASELETQTPPVPPRVEGDPQVKWYLKEQITKFGQKQTKFRRTFCVAAFSNDEIIVTDAGHRLLISHKLQSPTRPEGLRMKGLENPSCVAVNKDDHLVLLDKLLVKVFNREQRLLHKFNPGGGPSSTPTCLAVDDSNLIAIGYEKTEEISIHNPDGSLVRTLPAKKIDSHLAIRGQRFIYTNFESRRLLSVDYIGRKVFSVDIPCDMHGTWGPTGVCCARDGSVYVAVHGWLSGGIYMFSSEGSSLGCVIPECKFPAGITLMPRTGYLVVATNTSVQIFHKTRSASLIK